MQNIGSLILKLLVACLIVGLILAALDIDPTNLLSDLGATAHEVFNAVVSAVRWAIPYILLGAVVVIPVFLIVMVLRAVRRR